MDVLGFVSAINQQAQVKYRGLYLQNHCAMDHSADRRVLMFHFIKHLADLVFIGYIAGFDSHLDTFGLEFIYRRPSRPGGKAASVDEYQMCCTMICHPEGDGTPNAPEPTDQEV